MAKKIRKPVGLGSSEKSKLIPSVSALNEGQKGLLRSLSNTENSIILVDGMAGSGKTFCAVSWGFEQFFKGKYNKLIFSRPTVEAGREHLGYMPGDMNSKLSPYMIPIFDSLGEHIHSDELQDLINSNKIITLPLAFMRGITFKNAFVLLDEAQNTNVEQMQLFLTRIGSGSKIVITGDTSQTDIVGIKNGFDDALTRLEGVKGLDIIKLDASSVVRHPMIPEIVERYKPSYNRGK